VTFARRLELGDWSPLRRSDVDVHPRDDLVEVRVPRNDQVDPLTGRILMRWRSLRTDDAEDREDALDRGRRTVRGEVNRELERAPTEVRWKRHTESRDHAAAVELERQKLGRRPRSGRDDAPVAIRVCECSACGDGLRVYRENALTRDSNSIAVWRFRHVGHLDVQLERR